MPNYIKRFGNKYNSGKDATHQTGAEMLVCSRKSSGNCGNLAA